MSDKKPENPPAFPIRETEYAFGQSGMSLRDYFAAKALQGILAKYGIKADLMGIEEHLADITGRTCEDIANNAYELADAMLKARES